MTALVGREVERTFSTVCRFWTGLPGGKTHQPGREDLPDLGEARSAVIARVNSRHARKLTQPRAMSRAGNCASQTSVQGRTQRQPVAPIPCVKLGARERSGACTLSRNAKIRPD